MDEVKYLGVIIVPHSINFVKGKKVIISVTDKDTCRRINLSNFAFNKWSKILLNRKFSLKYRAQIYVTYIVPILNQGMGCRAYSDKEILKLESWEYNKLMSMIGLSRLDFTSKIKVYKQMGL